MMKKNKIDFGFSQVDIDQKASLVGEVFSSVAGKYDIMNDVMSFGLHRKWKDDFVAQIPAFDGTKLLDLAGGTGDISFRFYHKALQRNHDVDITISDINQDMLEQCKERAINNNILKNVDFKLIDAEKIPFDDNVFDYVTIAFGIRNVTDRPQALSEIFRVLKTGGKFYCLEFSKVDNAILSELYDQFSFKFIPKIGQLIAGDKDSYQYLVESIRKFPSCKDFADEVKKAGFSQVDYQIMTKGVVAIHSGVKL